MVKQHHSSTNLHSNNIRFLLVFISFPSLLLLLHILHESIRFPFVNGYSSTTLNFPIKINKNFGLLQRQRYSFQQQQTSRRPLTTLLYFEDPISHSSSSSSYSDHDENDNEILFDNIDNVQQQQFQLLGNTVENDSSDIDNVDDDDIVVFDIDAARERLESILDITSSVPYTVRQFHSTTGSTQDGGRNGGTLTTYLYYKSLSSLPALDFLNGRAINEISNITSIQHLLVSNDHRPLTTIEQIRLQKEIEYIRMVQYNDEMITQLSDFWMNERGTKAASKLHDVDVLINTGGVYSWTMAEKILVTIINQYGFFWVEPIHKLATLYYVQGHLTAAKVLFQIVLYIKPWHIGSISTLVKTYSDLDDHDSATILASRRLPMYYEQQQSSSSRTQYEDNTQNTSNDSSRHGRRIQWVNNMVQEATKQLHQRQEAAEQLFGPSDEYVVTIEQRWNQLHIDIKEQWQ
jgi:hypothetical protein